MKKKISLCLIVLNELEGCKIDIKRISKNYFYEVIAIDGGSTDGTIEFLKKNKIKVYRQKEKGLNNAYILANKICKGDYIVSFFPKGNLRTKDLYKFEHNFDLKYDLVVASRKIKNAQDEEDNKLFKLRKWGVLFLAYFSYLIWNSKSKKNQVLIKDILHGFKGWKKKTFKKMNIVNVGSCSIDIQMIIRCYKLDLPMVEFPTKEKQRLYGKTHFKILPSSYQIAKYLLFEILRKE